MTFLQPSPMYPPICTRRIRNGARELQGQRARLFCTGARFPTSSKFSLNQNGMICMGQFTFTSAVKIPSSEGSPHPPSRAHQFCWTIGLSIAQVSSNSVRISISCMQKQLARPHPDRPIITRQINAMPSANARCTCPFAGWGRSRMMGTNANVMST